MKRLEFEVLIDAPREKVWDSLWLDKNYRDWTSVFCQGSYLEVDWTVGGKARFLAPGESGMHSRIVRLEPGVQVWFEHLGEIQQGVDQPEADWAGFQENYLLTDAPGGIKVSVTVDVTDDHLEYFGKTFPNGLQRLKQIAES
ncbi:MAG TPA: SRPBCC domain-containing protein [Flavobacterium sp.]|nr:SRPBCC domain-containing protein [Flavobacterium sp.]